MNKIDKKVENKKKIATAIADLEAQIRAVEKLNDEFFEAAYEAAKLGQDEYAEELLENIAYLQDFTADLKLLTLRVKTAAKTASAFESLSSLPSVVSACNKLVVSFPNMQTLGKDIKKLNAKLTGMRTSLKDFTAGLKMAKNDPLHQYFPDTDDKNDRIRKNMAELKNALTARLMNAPAASPVQAGVSTAATTQTPAAAGVGAGVAGTADPAGIDSIISGLDDSRRG